MLPIIHVMWMKCQVRPWNPTSPLFRKNIMMSVITVQTSGTVTACEVIENTTSLGWIERMHICLIELNEKAQTNHDKLFLNADQQVKGHGQIPQHSMCAISYRVIYKSHNTEAT